MASSDFSTPSLYDDDDIVDVRRRRHSSSREDSSSSSSSSSSQHRHHHHHHDSANARLQRSVGHYASSDVLVQRFYRWVFQLLIILALAALSFVLWKRNRALTVDLANREGTNVVLASRVSKLEADQKNLLLEIEALERDKAELSDINRALRETLANAIGGAR
jgi:hypothetical protein